MGLAGEDFSNVPLELSHTTKGAFASRSIAGNIGAALLSRFRITFDYKDRTVTLVPASDVNRPFRSDMTGLSLDQQTPDALIMLAVAPGSPAAEVGIKANDRIVSIDGRSIKEAGLGLFDLAAPRFSVSPFKLGVERAGRSDVLTIRPRDYLHPALANGSNSAPDAAPVR